MSTLFSQLRLEFSGANAVARLEKTGAQEPTRFEIGYEKGDDFTLSAPGWIFHGARCRFTLDGQIEIKDAGEKWPGLSTLKRAP